MLWLLQLPSSVSIIVLHISYYNAIRKKQDINTARAEKIAKMKFIQVKREAAILKATGTSPRLTPKKE